MASDMKFFVWRLGHLARRVLSHRNQPPTIAYSPEQVRDLLIEARQPTIAFDVFDTLVKRTITPEHSKLVACGLLARALGLTSDEGVTIYSQRAEIEARLCRESHDRVGELEFQFCDVVAGLYEFLQRQVMLQKDMTVKRFADLALQCEHEAERRVLRPIDTMTSLVRELAQQGKRCILITDFYLPESSIRVLLAPYGILEHVDAIYVSCDRKASKRTGRLFDIVLAERGLQPCDLLIVGDNPWSDVRSPMEKGLAALHVDNIETKSFYKSAVARVDRAATLREKWRKLLVERNNDLPNFRLLAPSLLLFTERLFKALRAGQRRHVFFLAREGQLLERMFNIYQNALGLQGDDRIATHYLLASRRSTYVASLQPLAYEQFDRYFGQYRAVSLHDFLSSLQFQIRDIEVIAAQIGTSPYHREADLPTSDVYCRLRENFYFRTAYENIRATQKENLQGYIQQFGVDLTVSPLCLVDVGWKGSIQDNLRNVLSSNITIEGYYVGLVAPGACAAHKSGLLFSHLSGHSRFSRIFSENRSLYEILLPANHGSALSYERDADGTFRAEMEYAAAEINFVRSCVLPVAEDMMTAFTELCNIHASHVLTQAVLEKVVADLHSDLVFSRVEDRMRWIANIHHRENFGIFAESRFGSNRVLGFSERAAFFKRLIADPRRELSRSFWPYYTCYEFGGPLLAGAYKFWRNDLSRETRLLTEEKRRQIL